MRQVIRELKTKNTFFLYWLNDNNKEVSESSLTVDFNPFLSFFKEKQFNVNQFCLIHWQAKPKGLRRWGIYDSKGAYYSSKEIAFQTTIEPKTVQLDESIIKTVPTAVLFVPNCKVINYKELEALDGLPVTIGK